MESERPAASPDAPVLVTLFFTTVALIGPLLVPRGPDRGAIQLFTVSSAVLMWIFYITTYTSQVNPSVHPELTRETIEFMAEKWGRPIQHLIKLNVGIESSGQHVTLTVDANQKVKALKALIREEWKQQHKVDVLTREQYLTFMDQPLQDEQNLADWRLRDASELFIHYKDIDIDVGIVSSADMVSLVTKSWHSISRLQDKIRLKWLTKYEVEVLTESHFLEFKDKILDAGTVADYNIPTLSKLMIIIKMMTVRMEHSTLEVRVELFPSRTIAALKEAIRAEWRARHSAEVLKDTETYLSVSVLHGTALDDDSTAQQSRLKDGSILWINRPVIVNPKDAILSTTIRCCCEGQNLSLLDTYAGKTYWWGIRPRKGDTLTFTFPTPREIRKMYFRSNRAPPPYHTSNKDYFYNTIVDVQKAGSDEYINIGAFSNQNGIFKYEPGQEFGRIAVIRFTNMKDNPQCVNMDLIKIDVISD